MLKPKSIDQIIHDLSIFPKKERINKIFEFIRKGFVTEKTLEIITSIIDINQRNKQGDTALIFAAAGRSEQIVELLIKHGADVNAKNKIGNSPIYLAAKYGTFEIIETLLKNGADVNIKNNRNITPLIVLINGRINKDFINLLLKYGAGKSINTRDKDGDTALMLAFTKQIYEESILDLIKAGADINEKDKSGNTILMLASLKNYGKVIEHILNLKTSNNVI